MPATRSDILSTPRTHVCAGLFALLALCFATIAASGGGYVVGLVVALTLTFLANVPFPGTLAAMICAAGAACGLVLSFLYIATDWSGWCRTLRALGVWGVTLADPEPVRHPTIRVQTYSKPWEPTPVERLHRDGIL